MDLRVPSGAELKSSPLGLKPSGAKAPHFYEPERGAGASVRVHAGARNSPAHIPKRLEDELCCERHLTISATEDFGIQEV